MRTLPLLLVLPAVLALTCGCSTAAAPSAAALPEAAGLRAYADEREFTSALDRWRDAAQRLQAQRRERALALSGSSATKSAAAPPAPAAAQTAPAAEGTTASAAADSITNVQTAGVDEGGIVKQAGDHLLILRRGRLFTVKVGGGDLRPVASIDAYAPGADPRGAWYDELLVAGQTAVVIGYSYQRGGTEIGLFDIGRDGSLAYRATYHLRSQDYYSSRNYASRLIGRELIFYTPTVLQPWGPAPAGLMPAMRRWNAQLPEDFQRILPATRIFRSDDEFDPMQPLALHTVTRCDLATTPLRCDSSAVLGALGRVFYVSNGSVWVWTATGRTRWGPGARPEPAESIATLFRLPLDGATPKAIKAVGVPVDQLSFLEERDHLSVLLRDVGSGEGMFGGERGAGRLALLRLPLAALGDGRGAVAREHYRRVPGGTSWNLQNRHVGDWLLWGSGDRAWALRPASADEAVELEPGHAVERIEALGRHALLVGNRGDELRFSAVRLERRAALAGSLGRPGARQGETRTHGFFYRALSSDEGLLGLPMLSDGGPRRSIGVYGGRAGAASVAFVRQRELQFSGLGELSAMPRETMPNDGCKASCVDWYGNARPIFLGERLFALMGYELVEGSLDRDGSAIRERRRVDFTPYAAGRDQRPSPFQ